MYRTTKFAALLLAASMALGGLALADTMSVLSKPFDNLPIDILIGQKIHFADSAMG